MKSSFLYSKFRYFLRWLESMRAPRMKLMAPAASTSLALSCAATARSALASSQRCDQKKVSSGSPACPIADSLLTQVADVGRAQACAHRRQDRPRVSRPLSSALPSRSARPSPAPPLGHTTRLTSSRLARTAACSLSPTSSPKVELDPD
jgi:hypothetical protein